MSSETLVVLTASSLSSKTRPDIPSHTWDVGLPRSNQDHWLCPFWRMFLLQGLGHWFLTTKVLEPLINFLSSPSSLPPTTRRCLHLDDKSSCLLGSVPQWTQCTSPLLPSAAASPVLFSFCPSPPEVSAQHLLLTASLTFLLGAYSWWWLILSSLRGPSPGYTWHTTSSSCLLSSNTFQHRHSKKLVA